MSLFRHIIQSSWDQRASRREPPPRESLMTFKEFCRLQHWPLMRVPQISVAVFTVLAMVMLWMILDPPVMLARGGNRLHPGWLQGLIAIYLVVGFWLYRRAVLPTVRRAIRTRCQLCIRCKYDMRGHDTVAHCPECREPYDRKHTRGLWRRWLRRSMAFVRPMPRGIRRRFRRRKGRD